MKDFETQRSKIEDEQFIEKFFNTYAEKLEEMVTQPNSRFSEEELEMVNKFRELKKLPREHRWFHDLLIKIGQDFRLTPDEIDVLKDKFLK